MKQVTRNLVEEGLRKRSVQWFLRILFAGAVTILLSQLKLDPLEFILYDWRAGLLPTPIASGHVVLVTINDQTLADLKHAPNAVEFSKVLEALYKTKPAHLVSLIRPADFPGSSDQVVQLAWSAQKTNLVYAENAVPTPGQKSLELQLPPFQAVKTEPAPLTRDHSLFTPRGISRRVIVRYQDGWTLQAKLAQEFNGFHTVSQYRGVFHYLDSMQAYVRYKAGFEHVSFSDVLKGNFSPENFRGRVVLIGRNTSNAANTFLTVPISKHDGDMSPMDIQANYIDSLITNSSPRLTPLWVTAVLTFFLCVVTMLVVMNLRPIRGLFALLLSMVAVIAASFILDFAFNIFFPVAAPLFGLIIGYYFVLPYRLILENRRSWEYYEKNRLLTQVEELKSNFIRLMSHDLKTPIARIQAMAEIVMREKDKLSAQQAEAIETITLSSEELSQFIGSILNLSRIQSKKVKLQLNTRDITQLLTRVIRNCNHLARRKNIEIVTDFEPLFSLKMDEDLMKQVFTNLVENAIKYSPENTRVMVSASEVNGKIQIQISDQGIGIPKEEIPYVFERFYRAQNAEFENSGTGLGLYLAKYFVGLHNGSIAVESAAQQGSTFSVSLPIDVDDEKGAAHV